MYSHKILPAAGPRRSQHYGDHFHGESSDRRVITWCWFSVGADVMTMPSGGGRRAPRGVHPYGGHHDCRGLPCDARRGHGRFCCARANARSADGWCSDSAASRGPELCSRRLCDGRL